MKALRVRYGWTQFDIYKDHSQISSVETGRNQLTGGTLKDAYCEAFGVNGRTLTQYRTGALNLEDFIGRASVKPGQAAPTSRTGLSAFSDATWSQEDVEELLVETLAARGVQRLLANGVVRSERHKLHQFPSWQARLAHMEAICQAYDSAPKAKPEGRKPQG